MVKLSHVLALTAGLCLWSANATTSTSLPDLPDISSLVGGGIYKVKAGGGGNIVTQPETTTDDTVDTGLDNGTTTDEETTPDVAESNPDVLEEIISVNDPTNVANPFPKGGITIHKSNKSSKNNKEGNPNHVKDSNGQGLGKKTTSTYFRG